MKLSWSINFFSTISLGHHLDRLAYLIGLAKTVKSTLCTKCGVAFPSQTEPSLSAQSLCWIFVIKYWRKEGDWTASQRAHIDGCVIGSVGHILLVEAITHCWHLAPTRYRCGSLAWPLGGSWVGPEALHGERGSLVPSSTHPGLYSPHQLPQPICNDLACNKKKRGIAWLYIHFN